MIKVENKLYTFGKEEAAEMAKHTIALTKNAVFQKECIDMKKAVLIMRQYRKDNKLGNRVSIRLKKSVQLRSQSRQIKSYRRMICPYTGIFVGKYLGWNPKHETAKWAQIHLEENRDFDLDNETDAIDWIILRLSPCVKGSVNDHKNGDQPCLWEIIDARAESYQSTEKAGQIVKISKIIESASGSERLNIARLLEMAESPSADGKIELADITGFLYEQAMKDPAKWLKTYSSRDREYLQIIYGALSTGKLTHDFASGYSALGNPIGRTLEEAVSYLRTDPNMYALLKTSVTENDIASVYAEQQKPSKSIDNKSLENELSTNKRVKDVGNGAGIVINPKKSESVE